MIECVLDGRPIPWARVSHKNGRAFNDPRQIRHRRDLAYALLAAANRQRFRGPVGVELDFDYDRNETRIRVFEIEDGRTDVPDIDNLSKQVLEALQDSKIIANDSQVAILVARKVGRD